MLKQVDWHMAIQLFPNHVEITIRDKSLRLWLRTTVPVYQLSPRAQKGLLKGLRRTWQRDVCIAFSVDGPDRSSSASTPCTAAATPTRRRRARAPAEARAPPADRPASPPVTLCAASEPPVRRPAAKPASSSAQLPLFGRAVDLGELHDFT